MYHGTVHAKTLQTCFMQVYLYLCSNEVKHVQHMNEAYLYRFFLVVVGKPLLSWFPNRDRQEGTKWGVLLFWVQQPGLIRTFSPGWCYQPGPKGLPPPRGRAHRLDPIGVTNRDQRSIFFPVLIFFISIILSFQLYLINVNIY